MHAPVNNKIRGKAEGHDVILGFIYSQELSLIERERVDEISREKDRQTDNTDRDRNDRKRCMDIESEGRATFYMEVLCIKKRYFISKCFTKNNNSKSRKSSNRSLILTNS